MSHKIVQLEPIASDWGDIFITAHITTEHRKTTVEWDVRYPSGMPPESQLETEQLIRRFMKRQHDDLVRLFGH